MTIEIFTAIKQKRRELIFWENVFFKVCLSFGNEANSKSSFYKEMTRFYN